MASNFRWSQALPCVLALMLGAQTGFGQTPQGPPISVVQGFIRFMAYHEAGHLLMNQVRGINASTWPREDIERYADQIAMILLTPDPGDPDGVDEIVGAANAWLKAGKGHAANDPHAPPEERAFNIICYVYGSDPKAFADFEQYIEPDWNCEEKYKSMLDQLMAGYVNDSDEDGVQIELTYAPPTPAMRDAETFLKESGILEDLSTDVGQLFKLTHPTKLVAMSCKGVADEGTFHFDTFRGADPSKNFDQIAICYELVDMWLKAKVDIPG